MVLPATVFLAAAVLRVLQPQQYEPARTSTILFEWTVSHVSRFGAAIVFLGMPGVVVLTGCVALLGEWRKDARLRQDAAMTLAILRRHLGIVLSTFAVLLAGTILTAVAVHIVTD
jgi:hypothetical protein